MPPVLVLISTLLDKVMEAHARLCCSAFDVFHRPGIGKTRVLLVDRLCHCLHQLGRLCVQGRQGSFQVCYETVGEAAAEILPHHHSQQGDVLRVGRHGVGGHHPPVASQTVGYLKLVVLGAALQGERHHWYSLRLGQQREPPRFQYVFRQVFGVFCAVGNDFAIALPHNVHELE